MEERIKNGIDRYVSHGAPTGHFLRYVLENNLMGALGHADSDSRADIFEICDYVYNEIPSVCHGSPAKVKAWIAQGGKQQLPSSELSK